MRFFILLFLFLILFSCNFCSAETLGISPREIDLSGEVGRAMCGKVAFHSSFPVNFQIHSRWSNFESRVFSDYQESDEEMGIFVEGAGETEVTGVREEEYCFVVDRPGGYWGVLLARAGDTGFGMGTWIRLSVKEEGRLEELGDADLGNNWGILIGLEVIFLLLCLLLLFLVRIASRKHREGEICY